MRKKLLRPIRITDQDETGANFVFQVSEETAKKFSDAGQWAFAIFENDRWELNIGCRPETLDNIIFDEFTRVNLDASEFENSDFPSED